MQIEMLSDEIEEMHEQSLIALCKFISEKYGNLSLTDAEYLLSNNKNIRNLIKEYNNDEENNSNLGILLDTYNNYVFDDFSISTPSYNSVKIYIQSIKRRLLTPEEVRELGYKSLAGDVKAMQKLTEYNLRLVVKHVMKVVRMRGEIIPLMDMISSGNLGLVKAASKYNPDFNTTFSTYALNYIKAYVNQAIDENTSQITTPPYIISIQRQYENIVNNLTKIIGRNISNEEIMKFIDLNIDELNFIKNINPQMLSLDMPIGEDDDSELQEIIPSKEDSIYDIIEQKESKEQVRNIIKELPINDQQIIYYRFYKKLPLSEVAKIFKLTREAIRLREARILKKMKKSINFVQSINNIQENPNMKKTFLNKNNICKKINCAYQKVKNNQINREDIVINDKQYSESNSDLSILSEKIDNIIVSNNYHKLFRQISRNDLVIYILKKGLIDNRIYSFSEIADILEMDEEIVKNTYKQVRSLNLDNNHKAKVK